MLNATNTSVSDWRLLQQFPVPKVVPKRWEKRMSRHEMPAAKPLKCVLKADPDDAGDKVVIVHMEVIRKPPTPKQEAVLRMRAKEMGRDCHSKVDQLAVISVKHPGTNYRWITGW